MFKVAILKKANAKICSEINRLTRQLGLTRIPPEPLSLIGLKEIILQKNFYFLIIRAGDRIVSLLTVYLTRIPTGLIAEAEDLIVDEEYRKWGLGPLLMQKAIEIAEKAGAKHISLRTNPQRTEANKMYKTLGFFRMETNFYRMNLPRK